MMSEYQLTLTERKVLIRIMGELSINEPNSYSEFPSLKNKDEIIEAIKTLGKEGFIEFDKEINLWITTSKGEKYIQEHKELFEPIFEEFYENF